MRLRPPLRPSVLHPCLDSCLISLSACIVLPCAAALPLHLPPGQIPEGAAKNFTFAWVCDAKGGLYLSVNKEHMVTCGTGTIDLAQTLQIKGAKPVSVI